MKQKTAHSLSQDPDRVKELAEKKWPPTRHQEYFCISKEVHTITSPAHTWEQNPLKI